MIKKKVWRYYCEFYKTVKGTKSSMELHESHCTANPGRSCRMCDRSSTTDLLKDGIALVRDKMKQGHDPEGMCWGFKLDDNHLEELRGLCDGCPACILACLRQSNTKHDILSTSFDYRDEARSYLAQKREDSRQDFVGLLKNSL